MSTEKKHGLTVITNSKIEVTTPEKVVEENYNTNPMYQKLLNFRLLQEKQKKRFSVDDLFKLC
ncbi:hypothetical protein IJD34_04310 [bacterium]|nr:hypothetical protein [bacterium]